jgi:polar amino acid transport system ATP-binding protein
MAAPKEPRLRNFLDLVRTDHRIVRTTANPTE